jgi:Fibronectin type III domain
MPTENTNGTPLTDLQGYTIVYGESPGSMNKWVQISDIGTTNYVLSGLRPGTWYFAVLSYTAAGANSALSNIVSKTIS